MFGEMKELSLKMINASSPYEVMMVDSNTYRFVTDYGVEMRVCHKSVTHLFLCVFLYVLIESSSFFTRGILLYCIETLLFCFIDNKTAQKLTKGHNCPIR